MMVPISDQMINHWADQIVGGSADQKGIQAQIAQQARSLFNDPNIQAAIDRGDTVAQYFDPYKQQAAQTLHMDPKWQQALMTTDPKTGIHSTVNLGQWQTKLMTDPNYGYQFTRSAKDAAAAAAQTIGRMFGATTGGTTLPALGV